MPAEDDIAWPLLPDGLLHLDLNEADVSQHEPFQNPALRFKLKCVFVRFSHVMRRGLSLSRPTPHPDP